MTREYHRLGAVQGRPRHHPEYLRDLKHQVIEGAKASWKENRHGEFLDHVKEQARGLIPPSVMWRAEERNTGWALDLSPYVNDFEEGPDR